MRKLKFPAAFIVCLLVMGLYFIYITIREPRHFAEKPNLNEILQMDLETNYPKTPEDVIVFYGKILSGLFNEELSNDQTNMLEMQARELMDQELLENYPQAQYANDMSERIRQYKKSGISYAIEAINQKKDITYNLKDGMEYAFVQQTYYTHRKSTYTKHKSEYTLRKSEDGRWMIYTLTWN